MKNTAASREGTILITKSEVSQLLSIGELHHALEDGTLSLSYVHAELGNVIIKKVPGRTTGDETFIFDSTGTALQDVAAASIIFERAVASGFDRRLNFAS